MRHPGCIGRREPAQLHLPPSSREIVTGCLAVIDGLVPLIERIDGELHVRAKADPRVKVLRTLPGAGEFAALVMLAEIGDISRFGSARKLACGVCGRRMESAWSNGKAAYRCRHGRTSAMAPNPSRPKNTYVREDKLMPHLSALYLLLTSGAVRARRRTRAGVDVKGTVSPARCSGTCASARSPSPGTRPPRPCRRAPLRLPRPSP